MLQSIGGSIGGGGGVINNPSDIELAYRRSKKKSVILEGTTLTQNAEKTLATLTGAGTIGLIELRTDTPGVGFDCKLRVYTDGSGTPDIDVELGVLFMHHNTYGSDPRWGGTEHWYHEWVGNDGHVPVQEGYMRLSFPIPYQNGAVVKLYTPNTVTSDGNDLYSIVEYTSEVVSNLRLEASALAYANRLSVAAANAVTELSLASGRGFLAWHGQFGAATTSSQGWLERNMNVYLDGEGTASYQTSGMEDYFGGAYYWQLVRDQTTTHNYSQPSAVLDYMSGGGLERVHMGKDWLNANGGLRFDNGIVVKMESAGGSVVLQNFLYCLLYYLEV